ncbi:MAG: glycosyltransferase family 39 protein, partial [Anaerolineae bacterium]
VVATLVALKRLMPPLRTPFGGATVWLLLAITVVLFLTFDRPLVRGDGLAYFMWLDSIARDHDLELANQVEHFHPFVSYQAFFNQKTQRYVSVFPYGSALLWAPFYWLAMLADRAPLFHINDPYFIQYQGITFPYSFFTMLGTNLLALASLALTYASARRFVHPLPAAAASLAIFVGTPLLYYSTIEPYSSHVPGTFAVALILFLYSRYRERTRTWFLMGVAAGLAVLIRWQLALYALPMMAIPLVRKELGKAGTFALGFLALAWHVPYSWQAMFGSPWVVPAAEQTGASFLLGPVFIREVLFSGEKGLFVWAPVAALALLGLAPLSERDRALSLAILAFLILQTLISASVADWWAGWGFGMRRMIELAPALALGLAAFLAPAHPVQDSFWKRLASLRAYRIGAYTLLVLCIAFSLLLLFSHLNFVYTSTKPEGDTAFREIVYHLYESSPWITIQVMKEHFGLWAWSQPGP